MGSYLVGVIGVALCVGILEEILPGGSGNRAYLRLLTGLCILAVMVAPLGALLGSLPGLLEDISISEAEGEGEYDKILQGTVQEVVREQLREAILGSLSSEFSVDCNNAEVGILFGNGEDMSLSRVVITLRGKDILKDPYEIEEYFGTLLGCECRVLAG